MSRRREFFVPTIVLYRGAGTPLHRQIYHQLAAAIREGVVRHGVRLPSTRLMAKLLNVSRNTVLAAYDDLAAEGLITGERGSGVRVNGGGVTGSQFTFSLRQVVRAAGYPSRIVELTDSDGNPLYLNW